jgi:hypothetical protein
MIQGKLRKGMNSIMTKFGAHPGDGEEVTVTDEVDVNICRKFVRGISDLGERMGEK